MSDDATPWWASEGADALAADEDPLARHLAARAAGNGHGPGDAGDGASDGDDDGRARPDADDPADPGHAGDRCGYEFCPICRGLDSLRRTHPEVATHLAEAARHLSLALREVADGLSTRPADGDAPDFESIPLDDLEGDDA